jgi:translocator assembly and maintenance protein 41
MLRKYCRFYSANSPTNSKLFQEQLRGMLDGFYAPIRFALAYGSGAYTQNGYDTEQQKATMVDLIFGVTHPEHWHSLNVRQNPSHYSCLKTFGVKAITYTQEKIGGRIYYNTDLVVNGIRIKYGVVSMHHLERDLLEWETMYLAGRMQKPVFSPN